MRKRDRSSVRLFVAIELVEPVRAALGRIQRSLEAACSGVRWVRPELLHLTVKFLGEVPDQQITSVAAGVARAAAVSGEFDLQITMCGCFPERGAVRVVWVGHPQPNDPLAACVNAVEEQMAAAGFPPEGRAFSPHITLGRVNEDRTRGRLRTEVQAMKLKPLSQTVNSLTLMSSVLGRGGPSYSPVSKSVFGESPTGSQPS